MVAASAGEALGAIPMAHQHPSDDHIALPLELLLSHIETDTDRVGVSEGLRKALIQTFRATWDQSAVLAFERGRTQGKREAFDEDTVRRPIPTE